MDAVILAAGSNTRLKGLIPTSHKPLLVVNGQTLVGRLVRQASEVANAETVVVVASPLNAQPVCEIVGERARVVLQAVPTSSLDALRIGLEVGRAEMVMVLCGDNIVPEDTTLNVLEATHPETLTVAVRPWTVRAGGRFTVFSNGKFWPPGLPVDGAEVLAWIGPIVAPREALARALQSLGRDTDQFADLFNAMTAEPSTRLAFAKSDASDIGIPEEVAR